MWNEEVSRPLACGSEEMDGQGSVDMPATAAGAGVAVPPMSLLSLDRASFIRRLLPALLDSTA